MIKVSAFNPISDDFSVLVDDNNQKGGANGGPHFDIDIADKCQLDDYFGMNRAMSGM